MIAKNEESYWSELAIIREEMLLKLIGKNITPTKVVSTLESVQTKFVDKFKDFGEKKEVKQVIAEDKLLIFCCNKFEYELVKKQLDLVRQFGFCNFDDRVTYETIYARFCVKKGKLVEATNIVAGLRRYIDENLSKKKRTIYIKEMQQNFDDIMRLAR